MIFAKHDRLDTRIYREFLFGTNTAPLFYVDAARADVPGDPQALSLWLKVHGGGDSAGFQKDIHTVADVQAMREALSRFRDCLQSLEDDLDEWEANNAQH